MAIVYDVFTGDNSGGPIDYSVVVATASSTVALAALPLSSSTRIAIRARDTVSGLTEQNTDAAVLITVDAAGGDATGAPRAPQAVRLLPGPNGSLVVEWAYPYPGPARPPTGFHVYKGTGGTPNYTTVAATVAFVPGLRVYRATLAGLTDGTAYTVGVRAYNASGEEPNTSAVTATAVATPPANVQSLAAALTY